MGRPRKLDEARASEARARYRLWIENAPRKIEADLGIVRGTLLRYVRGVHKAARADR